MSETSYLAQHPHGLSRRMNWRLYPKSAMRLAGCSPFMEVFDHRFDCPQLRILLIIARSKVGRRMSIRKAERGTYMLVFSWISLRSGILRM